jgi:hypothetical protein
VAAALTGGGPSFILARVTGEEQPAPRIPYPPEEIRDRFRSCLAGRGAAAAVGGAAAGETPDQKSEPGEYKSGVEP